MGIFDNLKNVLGGKKDTSIEGTTKAPSQVLKENGIDPSGLKFAFGSDGTVTVSGKVRKEADKARISEVLEGIPGIKQVKQDLTVAPADIKPAATADSPLAGPAASRAKESSSVKPEDAAQSASTYTVQPGDTLSKIAKQFYGDGSKYMKIFEANQNILKNPDHILPGQKLVIPEK